jgi:uncharacterized membrane protein
MRNYLIPMVYVSLALLAGFTFPRFELLYFPTYVNDVSINSALATLGAIASGTMALSAIIFSIAYITVQFSAIAYSPRLALWFANDPRMFHALGIFMATFVYALWMMAWVDRHGNGAVPLMSSMLVVVLLIASTYVFALLIRGLSELQMTNTLRLIGNKGRAVIAEMYPRFDRVESRRDNVIDLADSARLGAVTQTVRYFGEPRTISKLDILNLVRMAEQAGAVIEITRAVGDTRSDESLLMNVRGAKGPLPERQLLASVALKPHRTFEQDPKYALRLLVDIAIKALSPAINDPTTAVQAMDQIEDLMRRLGRRELDVGYARDTTGILRVIFPVPTWDDYLHLSFDEIRQFGGNSVQLMRRLRSALSEVAEAVASETRTATMQAYLNQLDHGISRSLLDADDRVYASHEDRQGLGLSRHARPSPSPPTAPELQRAG